MMPIERQKILKSYLILCEGKDAELFLINYLESKALAKDKRFSNNIQVLDFGGNDNLSNYLMNLKNMDGFDKVTTLAVVRDAEKNYYKANHDVCRSIKRCGIVPPEQCGVWIQDNTGLKVGFILFPLNNEAGTLEDLCLKILSEKENKKILSSIDMFIEKMELSYNRHYHQKHKNRLYTYLSTSDKYVTMRIGTAAKAGAFNWNSIELKPLHNFLVKGFL